MHGDKGSAEVVAQMLSEGFYGGFRGVVGRVTGGIGDALFGAGDDDGGRCRRGLEMRKEGGDAVNDPKEVSVHDLGGVWVNTACGEKKERGRENG